MESDFCNNAGRRSKIGASDIAEEACPHDMEWSWTAITLQ